MIFKRVRKKFSTNLLTEVALFLSANNLNFQLIPKLNDLNPDAPGKNRFTYPDAPGLIQKLWLFTEWVR